MTPQEYAAAKGAIERDWPRAEYPGMHGAMLADLDRQYKAANTPPAPPAPAPAAPKPPRVVSEPSKDAPTALSRSEEAEARRQRIADGVATDDDLPFMTAAELRDLIAVQHEAAMSTPKEDTKTLADLQAEKVIEDPIDIDRAMRNAAQRRLDAAWADRLSDRARELVGRGIPADTAKGIAEQQIAAERLAAGEAPVSGVAQAEADVRKAFDALPKADQ